MLRPPKWATRASCDGHVTADLDMWHPELEDERHMWERARLICAACPVLAECRAYGVHLVTTTGVDGMFGGLTPTELRRKAIELTGSYRKQAQHGTRAKYVRGCRCRECREANRRDVAARRRASAAA